MTDQEIYALKEQAREAAREMIKQGPQWLPNMSSRIEAFAEGAAWQAQRAEAKQPLSELFKELDALAMALAPELCDPNP